MLKTFPYDAVYGASTEHPLFPSSSVLSELHSVESRELQRTRRQLCAEWRVGRAWGATYPSCDSLLSGMVQVPFVCSVTLLGGASLTPSRMSTSPADDPTWSSASQTAGQVAQPWGMCLMSNLWQEATSACGRCGRGGHASRHEHGYVISVLGVALDPVAHTPGPARCQVRRVVSPHDERIVGCECEVVRNSCRLVDVVPIG